MSAFELLVITGNSMQRLKQCLVETFSININNNLREAYFGIRAPAMLPSVQEISFELKGRALNMESSFTEGERVEIVKRLDAYEGL